MTDTKKGLLQRIPLIMPVFVLIAALYAGWVFYTRWSEAAAARRAAAAREAERDRQEVELNGGSQLKITMLYASPAAVRKGQPAQICYGVVNARDIAFDPPIDNVWPSLDRCVDVKPKKSTTYTLSAKDDAGHAEKAQVTVQVK